MTIQEWIDTGADYDTGLILYRKQPRHNKNFLRKWMLKDSTINQAKLKYELSKLSKFETANTIRINVATPPPAAAARIFKGVEVKEYRTLLLNQLPKELHEMYIKQKADFYRASSMKISLNDLLPDDEAGALSYCIEIERLFDSIEKSWKVFDHYLEHKTIPTIEQKNDYSELSPVLLLKAEKSKRELISKAKRKIQTWSDEKKVSKDPKRILKLTRMLETKAEDQLTHEVSLETIKELINK